LTVAPAASAYPAEPTPNAGRAAPIALDTPVAPGADGSSGEDSAALRLQALRDAITRAVSAGADWVQIREKDLDARPLVELAQFAAGEARRAATRVMINDRLDVALAANAAGVHLGENSVPLEAVRDWRRSSGRSQFLIGVSCHSLEAARAAEFGGANYIFFGPVFDTPSKLKFGPPQGIERLRQVCAAVRIPVLAIGGINLENAGKCIAAGAAGIAAIRLFQGPASAEELGRRLEGLA
jgi:thiamine-phosphate pyrophosphorylase